MYQFEAFPKIPRLRRSCVVSEKIDGTNAQIFIGEDGEIVTGSRNRVITPEDDNYGFAAWVRDNREDLLLLGPGRHFGEWWGNGIQRGYGLAKGEKRFSLFNASRWGTGTAPRCCSVVPVLYHGEFSTDIVRGVVATLSRMGSLASPGFMNPEGIVLYHEAGRQLYKMTCEDDGEPKGAKAA